MAKKSKSRTRKLTLEEILDPSLAANKDNSPSKKQIYAKYLRSKEWIEKRDTFREAYGNQCVMCGSSSDLHVHHLSYDNLGNETINDVVLLCKGCHLDVHKNRLLIWMFTKEEMSYFKKIKDAICNNKNISYLAIVKKDVKDSEYR